VDQKYISDFATWNIFSTLFYFSNTQERCGRNYRV